MREKDLPQQAPRPHPTLCAVVVNGDLDDYMDYYKARYRTDIHLSRYDPDSIAALGLIA